MNEEHVQNSTISHILIHWDLFSQAYVLYKDLQILRMQQYGQSCMKITLSIRQGVLKKCDS